MVQHPSSPYGISHGVPGIVHLAAETRGHISMRLLFPDSEFLRAKDFVQLPYTLWWTNKKLLKMAIEIVDFPIKNGDPPLQNVNVHQRVNVDITMERSTMFNG